MSHEGQQQFERWHRHRTVLLPLLQDIHSENLDYKPWENAHTLGALVVHIAASSDMFLRSILNGSFSPPSISTQYETIDDIRSIVQASSESSTALFAELSDSQLEQPLDFNGFVAPGGVWLNNMVDHEIHHKGQLFTYVRSAGIEKVPFFIMQPSKQ
ncbi:DinB family protein [Paenibacillus solani]|uniref:DinB family protein n=1 Tax=Paenibacillus solani TaxID=1705565 RepID=UPI003D28A04C